MKEIKKEGVLVVLVKGEVKAFIRREEQSGHQVVYMANEAGAEDIESIVAQTNE